MTRAGLACALLMTMTSAVEAHQLDEYLQAARITISPSRVEIDLHLTPGVAVAPGIVASIDEDGDALVSPQELERYARRVMEEVTLRIDDRAAPLALERTDAPGGDEFGDGLGTIRIYAVARTALTSGLHRVHFENAHARGQSVYLVNATKPATNEVAIRAQERDRLQHGIDLDVEVGSATPPAIVWMMTIAFVFGLRWRALRQFGGLSTIRPSSR